MVMNISLKFEKASYNIFLLERYQPIIKEVYGLSLWYHFESF